MTNVSNVYRVFIHAASEKVFTYVSDLARHPEWSGGKLRIESLTPGPVAVGNQYRSYGEVAGQQDRPNELLITRYESPTRFTFTAQDPGFGEVVNDFKFLQQEGGTLMERTLSMKMNPFMAFAFRLFIRPLIGQPMMDKAFGRLKQKLEQSQQSTLRTQDNSMTNDQRRVVNHTIISDILPALEITVDPAFAFVGVLRFILKETALVERFIFADRQDSETKRIFIVQFEGVLDGVKFKYNYRITNPIKLGHHDYRHNVWVYSNAESVRDDPGAESDQTTQFLQARGYSHGDGLAMSRFARIIDEARRHEIIIFYQETLDSLGLSLESYEQLTPNDQKAFEQAITERSLKSFQVTDR